MARTFRQRRDAAVRRALDVLPAAERPPLTTVGAGHRPCGPCQACCEVQQIEALTKPAWQRCPNQCASGCAVHSTGKPAECVYYRCAWSLGLVPGGDASRPDALGLVVDFRAALDRDGSHRPEGEDLIALWEVRPGAALEPDGWALLEALVWHGRNLVLVPHGAPQLLDGRRVRYVRLLTAAGSHAPPALFNHRPSPVGYREDVRSACEEALR